MKGCPSICSGASLQVSAASKKEVFCNPCRIDVSDHPRLAGQAELKLDGPMRVFLFNPSLHEAEWFYLEDAKCRQSFEKQVHRVIGLSLQGYMVQSYEGKLLDDGSYEAFIYEPTEFVSLGWIFRYGQPLREAAIKTVISGQELFFVRSITNSAGIVVRELYFSYMSLCQQIILCDGTELQYQPALQQANDSVGRLWKPRISDHTSKQDREITGWSPCNFGSDGLWYNPKALFVC